MWVEQSHQEKYKSKHIVYNRTAASIFIFEKKRLHQTLRVEQKSMNKEHEPISIGADISQRLSSSFGQGSSRKIQFQ